MRVTNLALISLFCFAQAHAYNLPKHPIKAYDCDTCSKLSHESLQDKWTISNQSLGKKISNAQKSYGYQEQISLNDLQNGITISTLAPGAVVRITPIGKKTIPQLKIKTPDNKLMSLKDASSLYSQDETFGDKLTSTEHQTIIQLKPELHFGKFILKSTASSNKNANAYVISVYDKFSDNYLQVETDSIHYQYGDKVTAIIRLKDAYIDYDVEDVDAVLRGPSGQVIPLEVTKIKNNRFEANTDLNSEIMDHGENWYLEVDIQAMLGDDIIKRSGHTAFSYAIPSASLLNIKKLSSKPLTFVATLDVATPSRYALQSVLYRKNSNGSVRPIETAQRAQWFEPGKQVIQFTFDNSHQIADDNLYLGYLRLIDYGQLKIVYQYNQPIKLNQLVE